MKKKLLSFLMAMALLLASMAPVELHAAESTEGSTSVEAPAEYADQYKAIWFAYYDYTPFLQNYSKNNSTNFKKFFKNVLTRCQNAGFNRIIVQVRPFGDAIYKSSYFPTSQYIAGKQGASLSYDPLKIMVKEAHKKGMAIEAWINPYRVSASTSYSKLYKKNQARKWHESKSASKRRNVLAYDGKLYYNPAKADVRNLIVKGVKEIVSNYDIDGIHMDDYFYPSFSSKNYKKVFDYKEYNSSTDKKNGASIQSYRRKQVNTLVSKIRSTVKSIKPDVTFGISPAGNIDNLTSKYKYYVDIKKWCSSTKYVDYIMPQIYWGFYHQTAKYHEVLNRWKSITDQSKVKLYIGLPAYKMGTNSGSTPEEKEEFKTTQTLAYMIQYGRQKDVDGFAVFDYQDLKNSKKKKYMDAMTEELNK